MELEVERLPILTSLASTKSGINSGSYTGWSGIGILMGQSTYRRHHITKTGDRSQTRIPSLASNVGHAQLN